MKYKRLILDFNYHYYREFDTDSLNSFKKNSVNYCLGKFDIYVDADKVEYGKNKLLKAAAARYIETIKQITNETL